MRCLLRFGGGQGGRLDGGMEVDDGNTTISREVDTEVGDAGLLRLMHSWDVYFRPIDLLFCYIGIVTI